METCRKKKAIKRGDEKNLGVKKKGAKEKEAKPRNDDESKNDDVDVMMMMMNGKKEGVQQPLVHWRWCSCHHRLG